MELLGPVILAVLCQVAAAAPDVRLHGQTLGQAFPPRQGRVQHAGSSMQHHGQHAAAQGHPAQHAAAQGHPAQHGAGQGHPAQHGAGAGAGHPAQHGAAAAGHHAQHGAAAGHHADHSSAGGGYAPPPPAGGGYAAPDTEPKSGICTDVSYVKPIEYEAGEVCCTTKIVEPHCVETVKKVTREVTETVCELIPTPKCQMKNCPVDVTYPEQYEKSFEPWACELRPKTLYHFKTLPVCHNVSKPICIEEWKTDYSTGQRYKVVTDQCEHAVWEECEDQKKKVPFQTMESQCWKDKEIWYETCKEVTSPVNLMCWWCQADAAEKCDTVTKKLTIDVAEKHCEPRTEMDCNPAKKTPTQEKVHQEKCLHHDTKGNMVHQSVQSTGYSAPQYPSYTYKLR